jgi:hypothetical protein
MPTVPDADALSNDFKPEKGRSADARGCRIRKTRIGWNRTGVAGHVSARLQARYVES